MRTELFELAGVHARWLTMRQEAVASNVANADRPGHRAVAAPDFRAVVDDATGARPLQPGRAVLPSGNTVDLASAMIEGSRIGRENGVNAAIVSAFHRMTLAGLGQ